MYESVYNSMYVYDDGLRLIDGNHRLMKR